MHREVTAHGEAPRKDKEKRFQTSHQFKALPISLVSL